MPTQRDELRHIPPVSPDVSSELLPPELLPRLWRRGQPTAWVPMPEAAMDEDDDLVLGKNDVRTTGKVAAIEPEPEARSVQQ